MVRGGWTVLAALAAVAPCARGHAALRTGAPANERLATSSRRVAVAAATFEDTDTIQPPLVSGAQAVASPARPPVRARRPAAQGSWVSLPDERVDVDTFPILPAIISQLKARGITQFTSIQVLRARARAAPRAGSGG